MKVLNITENDDGSSTVNLDLTQEEAQYLLEQGFITLLEKAVTEEKLRRRVPALFKEKVNSSD
ncbi:hypothetical protein UFOVP336_41 [uncultured Caudovirales phage]|uniref:Uncharacterized protein n=1 Tax=uncultured Caudovirales phage TaxID=2100421 RepID=A0A6J5LXQ4_9CAUD|nr:hypothetical protein UFOVP336_41 [uncultured Caudovirales phage]